MTYDWRGETPLTRLSAPWFEALDRRQIEGHRLFATDREPFDRVLPLDRLAGKQVLEIGCGMGLHTEVMAARGAQVTAVDLTPTAVQATQARLTLRA